MRELRLDASRWLSRDDFYNAFLEVVGAPNWHGRNLEALRDSIITGQINEIEAPYRLIVEHLQQAPASVVLFLKDVAAFINRRAVEEHCDVQVIIS